MMEFFIETKPFKEALKKVSLAANGKTPLTSCVKLISSEVQGKPRLTLTAYNAETMAIACALGLEELTESGEVAVPANLLGDIVDVVTAEKVTLKVVDNSLLVIAGKSETKIPVIKVSDLPAFPQTGKDCSRVELASKVISEALRLVAFAVPNKEGQRFRGMAFDFSDKTLSFVGTDGNRMAALSIPLEYSFGDSIQVVPAETLPVIKSLLGEGQVKVVFDDKSMTFFFGNTLLVIQKKTDLVFPNYKTITKEQTPDKAVSTVKVKASSFEEIFRLAGPVVSRAKDKYIDLAVGEAKIGIKASALDGAAEYNGEISVETTGQEIQVRFNYDYLEDHLKVFTELELYLLGEKRPLVLGGNYNSALTNASYYSCVLPIMIAAAATPDPKGDKKKTVKADKTAEKTPEASKDASSEASAA